MARLSSTDKAELLQVAAAIDPRLDRTLIGHLAELAAQGCQAKDVKVRVHWWLRSVARGQPCSCYNCALFCQDFLRCVVARSAAASLAPAQPVQQTKVHT